MSSKFGHLSKMSSSCTSPASTLAPNESGFQGPPPPLLIMPNSKTLRNLLPWLMRKSRSSCPADLSPSTSWECRPTTMRSMQDLHQIAMTFKVRSWQKKNSRLQKEKIHYKLGDGIGETLYMMVVDYEIKGRQWYSYLFYFSIKEASFV